MSVKIRMKRVGTKKRPMYRIVVADSRSPRDGRNIEVLGNFNPMVRPEEISIKLDRLEHWLKAGATASGTVKGLVKRARSRAKGSAAEAKA